MSAPDPTPLCPYCQRYVDPVSDCWISHGMMAHTSCAWAADEAFFALRDAEEERNGNANK